MTPQQAAALVGHQPPRPETDIVERLSGMDLDALAYQYEQNPGALFSKYVARSLRELQAQRIEVDRLRTALRAVRACTDPSWQAQLISDALREEGR